MGIGIYLKEIGRGKEGARALSRAQACDLWGQLLDGSVTDLEIGAFCLAMRIKGETPEEMAGFLDATAERLQSQIEAHQRTLDEDAAAHANKAGKVKDQPDAIKALNVFLRKTAREMTAE